MGTAIVVSPEWRSNWRVATGPPAKREHRAQQEPDRKSAYTRHYAFKGRGRKEFLRQDMKVEVNELVLTREGAGLGV
ncbi:hypothetical protein TSOC_002836 [Tetrabaena socialis]|uniref:Uncharacterized protein n=1 Tax=Tetrabaena socialis TaxID=47790 RepID=A0A2J8AD59_9CHLO|nr:hypothetical protein TSOC_002836 [Tetrabaena socialis]|eukprot:PNH10443.1 hypothetical protein TSOC_002836 [Tetrabaena socialis]